MDHSIMDYGTYVLIKNEMTKSLNLTNQKGGELFPCWILHVGAPLLHGN